MAKRGGLHNEQRLVCSPNCAECRCQKAVCRGKTGCGLLKNRGRKCLKRPEQNRDTGARNSLLLVLTGDDVRIEIVFVQEETKFRLVAGFARAAQFATC